MTKTSVKVSFGLYALAIKQDSVPSATDLQSFSKIDDLRTDSVSSKPYCTYEPNFWVLDGNYKFVNDDETLVHVGMMSQSMSDVAGIFSDPPVLTINFSLLHTVTNGITLHFSTISDDYSGHVNVKYYNGSYSLICSDDYYPSSTEFSTLKTVTDFKRIVITFYTTNKPFRYLRLRGLDYGELVHFTEADIKTAQLVEETDMLAAEARVNTFSMTLYSNNADFSIIAPAGDYSSLLENQPMSVYGMVEAEEVFMGQYYLHKWKNKSETEISFDCVDLMGVIDAMEYMGGIYSGTTLVSLLTSMLGSVYIPYLLDPTLDSIPITGWIPIGSYRETLQQIAFACGCFIDSSRDRVLKINPIHLVLDDETYDYTISKSEKSSSQTISLKPLVTGVEVTAHNFYAGSESLQLYNGTLPTGSHKIPFGQPMHTLSVTGATITSSGANYAILNVAAQGTVTLSGLKYVDTQRVYSVYMTGLDPSVKPNVKKVQQAYLINSSNAQTIAQRIYDYYQQRYIQTVTLYAPSIMPSEVALIDTLYSKQFRSCVEKMQINLAGGFRAQTELVGVEHVA